jgi:hypothetical protein
MEQQHRNVTSIPGRMSLPGAAATASGDAKFFAELKLEE